MRVVTSLLLIGITTLSLLFPASYPVFIKLIYPSNCKLGKISWSATWLGVPETHPLSVSLHHKSVVLVMVLCSPARQLWSCWSFRHFTFSTLTQCNNTPTLSHNWWQSGYWLTPLGGVSVRESLEGTPRLAVCYQSATYCYHSVGVVALLPLLLPSTAQY